MYSVIETGGSQYRVGVGDTIDIDLTGAAPGETVEFDRVLMVSGDKGPVVGTPTVEAATVTGEVIGVVKGPKLIVFKHKRRKDHRKKTGHRQRYTRVKISAINVE